MVGVGVVSFTITSTATCDECGAMLSSSDSDCSHEGKAVEKRLFRRLFGGPESLVSVTTTRDWMWHSLKEDVGDDWIAYQYLGTVGFVESKIDTVADISSLSWEQLSLHAPSSVEEHGG